MMPSPFDVQYYTTKQFLLQALYHIKVLCVATIFYRYCGFLLSVVDNFVRLFARKAHQSHFYIIKIM